MSSFLLLSFVLLSLISSPTMIKAKTYLTDIQGDAVVTGNFYYLLPIEWGAGGGLSYAQIQDRHSRNPNFVVTQSPNNECQTNYGLPITLEHFDSEDDKENTTFVDDDTSNVAIMLPLQRSPYGPHPTRHWKMDKDGIDFTVVLDFNNNNNNNNGSLGVDADESRKFKIVKNEAYGYRIAYCSPSVVSALKGSMCGSLKPVYDRRYGIRRLVLTGDDENPFQVMFVKAKGYRSPHPNI